MTNIAKGKKTFAFAAVALLVATAIAVPSAYAFYYARGDAAEESTAQGAIPVIVTVDETAISGGVHSSLVMVPSDCTSEEALTVAIISSEAQNDIEAIHDYDYESVADYLAGKTYTVPPYTADAPEVGTHTTEDTEGTSEIITLDRYYRVVVTVTA